MIAKISHMKLNKISFSCSKLVSNQPNYLNLTSNKINAILDFTIIQFMYP